jgi:hypothetical protein
MSVCLDKALLGAAGAGLSVGIDKLAELIEKAIKNARGPVPKLAPFLTSIEAMFRPGMSAISLTSSIVSRLGEAGIETGSLPDGSEPQIVRFVRVTTEENVRSLQNDCLIETEVATGTTLGVSPSGPTVCAVPFKSMGVLH